MGGILRNEDATLLEVGGIEDHVHLLLATRPDQPPADLMRVVKSNSSRWVCENFQQLSNFKWQEGYAVFSVSSSNEQAVRDYLLRQHEHHKVIDFKTELRKLLDAHKVKYEEKYLD